MTPERYKQVEEIFNASLEREAGERAAFLELACANDDELLREVESLLAAQDEAGSFIETQAIEVAAAMLAAGQTDIRAGRMIGPYRIRHLLGAGGMGEIYLAEDTRLDRLVALKLLPAQFTGDENSLRRFVREAKAASALNHPNILTIHDIGQVEGIHFIATEFVEGHTLRHLMKSPRTIGEAIDIAAQIAGALTAAHLAGIVHRDIKPENIMLRPDGLVKVLDFGIAKLTERRALTTDTGALTITGSSTRPGMLIGTPQYMSPEQARGQEVDARSDIFSLGVVLYEMIAGCPPFTGETALDVIASLLTHEPAPLDKHHTEVPRGLQEAIARALAKPTTERYQTIRDFRADLKRLGARPDLSISGPNKAMGREPEGSKSNSPTEIHPNNLPPNLGPLVGRDIEISAVERELLRDEVRMLTLTGPGGTGKSSLALRVAADLLDTFADGVFFISLASIGDPALVTSAIAQTLGIKEAVGSTLIETVKLHLGGKQMLLVLDNFEHLLSASPLVAEMLNECARLKCLVTSRAVLHLRAEHEYSLPPLALPDPERLSAPEDLTRCPAVALFMQRAIAVKPDFAMNKENARAVAEICIQLDGLPLAIELAAARIKMLSPPSLLARMENRFQLLTGGARDLPARQQTMRSAIAWSYDLLSEDEKLLFRRLSIFTGGCALEAIESVCDGAGDLEVDMLSGVESLVDKSLVRQSEQTYGDEPHFMMLETIREYGLERLMTSGEIETLWRRHASFYLALAEEAEPELKGSWQSAWLERLEREHGNLRAALQWAKRSGNVEVGLRLSGALWRFWRVRSHFSEGRGWLEGFLALAETSDAPASARAKALLGLSAITMVLGDYDMAGSFCEQSLALYREMGDKGGIANSLSNLATATFEQGNYERGLEMLEENLKLQRELKDNWGIASSLNNLGVIAHEWKDYDRARAFFEESLTLRQGLEDKRGIAYSLNNLGAIALHRGDYDRAKALTAQSLTILHSLGEKAGVAHCLEGLAELLCGEGRSDRAARLLGVAKAVREGANAPVPPHNLADYEGVVARVRDRLDEEVFASAFAQGQAMTLEQGVAYALDLGDEPTLSLTDAGKDPGRATDAKEQTEGQRRETPSLVTMNRERAAVKAAAASVVATAPQAVPAISIFSSPVASAVSSSDDSTRAFAPSKRTLTIALSALVFASIAFGLWRFIGRDRPAAPLPNINVTRLTTTGKDIAAAVSPDGKYVVHVIDDAGRQSLWLRHVSTKSNSQIVAPAEAEYGGVTFTHDGNYVCYVRKERGENRFTLYQIPVLGGASKRIIGDLNSGVTCSPDDRKFAFVRHYPQQSETALVVANADGTGEEKLVIRRQPEVIRTEVPAWSPDGRLIAIAVESQTGGLHQELLGVSADNRVEQPLGAERWDNLGGIAWLGDGSGLLIVAREQPTSPYRIWQISHPGGEASRITNDQVLYWGLSVTADSRSLVTLRYELRTNVWVTTAKITGGTGVTAPKQITYGIDTDEGFAGVCWTPDGNVVYAASSNGYREIWISAADGTGARPLTVDVGRNYYPTVSPDGRCIVFTSNRKDGNPVIWKMDMNGTNLTKVTGGTRDFNPHCSPDSQWVVYSSSSTGEPNLWKAPIDGGEPVQLTDTNSSMPAISPDGKLIAYLSNEENHSPQIAIIPAAGGRPTKVFNAPPNISQLPGIRWLPDGKSLAYVETREGVANVWSLPLDGGGPKQLTDFKSALIFAFDLSRDGKQFVCARGVVANDVVLINNFR